MFSPEEILQSYESGNQDRRLQLFMAYRLLREQFAEIDLRHPLSDTMENPRRRSAVGQPWGGEFCRRLHLCWRVLRGLPMQR